MPNARFAPRNPVIIIPSRMGSLRLPGKPLADINGQPMIAHVWKRAMESKIGRVVVACDDAKIVAAVKQAGGEAVLTRPEHASGSDRIWEALNAIEGNAAFDAVINIQGDEPALDPAAVNAAWDLLADSAVDIGTVAAEIKSEEKKHAPQVVKAAVNCSAGEKRGRALYFSRQPVPSGDGPLYHHVGLYAYRRDALAAFVGAKPAPIEKRESLEQLRALALGLRIDVAIIDAVPLGVDTSEDLEAARKVLAGR